MTARDVILFGLGAGCALALLLAMALCKAAAFGDAQRARSTHAVIDELRRHPPESQR